MDGLSLISLVWPVLAMLLGGLEISIAMMLLKEEGAGPRLMLAGALAGLLGNISSSAAPFLWEMLGRNDSVWILYSATWALTALGATVFTIGLLLYVLRRRALATRISELEAILASRNRD
ncbi:MAG: hypothetical protein EOP85_16700 [Verrucomicrobiaceae bacterium]|nr:MAG: hypothetical protein EOP85_16700 [Verrucomicrobiaceae bacterium]